MKTVLTLSPPPHPHWVGDGFPVRSLFSYHSHGQTMSPFLLLDYAGPAQFSPTQEQRGVGTHPHRGFETVTIVYQGEVAHRDSTGQGGVIGPGDVQWMTAGSGILHEEFHSPQFSQQGGALEMVQLWVNLPAKAKMTAPAYQTLLNAHIPQVALPDGAGTLRVIAGQYDQHAGPAHTHSPLQVWDLQLHAGKSVDLPATPGWNTAIVVLQGSVEIAGTAVQPAQWALLSPQEDRLRLTAQQDATVLLLSGQPLEEPIVGHGPFVMNTEDEIRQAFMDFQQGRFGRIPAIPLATQDTELVAKGLKR